MTIRGRIYGGFGSDVAARAGAVLDNKRVAEALRQPLTDQARGDVVPTPRCEAHDDADRPSRIALAIAKRVTVSSGAALPAR